MGRWIILPLVGLSLLVASCRSQPKALSPQEEARRNQIKWKEAVVEEQQRLKGEQPKTGAALVASRVGFVFWGMWGQLWDYTTGNTPAKAARNLLDPNNADNRRDGIFYLDDRDWGRKDPYNKQYARIAESDPDYTVRAAGIRALNRARDRRYISIFVKDLDNENMLVRLEAAKALANMPDESAVQPLLKHLNNPDEDHDVRVAAADALRSYKTADVQQALVRLLSDRDFGLAWQARRSLWLQTGQDFRYDPAAWLGYLTK